MRQEAAQAVRAVYDAVGLYGSQAPQGLSLTTGRDLALALGYPAEWLAEVPETLLEAFVGAGPVAALGTARPGEVVVDLGCGAGVDSFLAARAGARVAAVDASAPMLARLWRAAATYPGGLDLYLLRGAAPHLPLADAVAHHVWLNGVANLVADRPGLCREIARLLRPEGQLLVADMFTRQPVPVELRELPEAWAWCVAGAGTPEAWQEQLHDAGFADVTIEVVEDFSPFCRGILRAGRAPR